MPVQWTISHVDRLVVAVARDMVTVSDVERYFADITAEGAVGYRKIFEIAHAPGTLSDDNLRALGARVVLYAQHGQVGPLAIVAASDSSFEHARTFAAAATARRPLAIFRELHLARQWLDAQPLPDD